MVRCQPHSLWHSAEVSIGCSRVDTMSSFNKSSINKLRVVHQHHTLNMGWGICKAETPRHNLQPDRPGLPERCPDSMGEGKDSVLKHNHKTQPKRVLWPCKPAASSCAPTLRAGVNYPSLQALNKQTLRRAMGWVLFQKVL